MGQVSSKGRPIKSFVCVCVVFLLLVESHLLRSTLEHSVFIVSAIWTLCCTDSRSLHWGYGATAARLTPDQKVGSSNLSGLIFS